MGFISEEFLVTIFERARVKWFQVQLTNSSGESETPWKMLLQIFTSDRSCLPAVNSILQFSMAFVTMLMILLDILHIFRRSLIPSLRDHIISRFVVDSYHCYIIWLFFPALRMCLCKYSCSCVSSCSQAAFFLFFRK